MQQGQLAPQGTYCLSLTVAMCSARNVVSTFSGKTKQSGHLHVLLMFIFSLFLTLERSPVEVVIRLLGCRLLCKVFALYALHTDASHSCTTVRTWLHVRITLRFGFQHVHQNRILTAVLDRMVTQQ
jgi:hypothetical protein